MKSVVILGAGIYQLPLIQKAKNLGYKTLVVSIPGNYPGLKIADEIINLDTRDYKGILDILSSRKIDAIVTTGTDVAIPTLGRLNEALNLHGLGKEGSVNASNKIKMKKLFVENGIPTARFVETESLSEGISFIDKYAFPIMVKAPNSSGGRGITQVTSKEQVQDAFLRATSISKGKVIFEEYIEGNEFGAQAFIHNGKLLFCIPHNDTVTNAPHFTPIGHSLPFDNSTNVETLLMKLTLQICKALSLNNCGLNLDLILTKTGEVKVIEVGARIGATCLPELIEISYGIDVYKLIIDSALGHKINFPKINHSIASSAELLRVNKTGKLKSIKVPNNPKGDFIIHYDYKIGETVNKFIVGPDRIGHIITTDTSSKAAEKKLTDFIQTINYSIE